MDGAFTALDTELGTVLVEMNKIMSAVIWGAKESSKEQESALKTLDIEVQNISAKWTALSKTYGNGLDTYSYTDDPTGKKLQYASAFLRKQIARDGDFYERRKRSRNLLRFFRTHNRKKKEWIETSPERQVHLKKLQEQYEEVRKVRSNIIEHMEARMNEVRAIVADLPPEVANDAFPYPEEMLTLSQIEAQDRVQDAHTEMAHFADAYLTGEWKDYDSATSERVHMMNLLKKYSEDKKLPSSWMLKEDRDHRIAKEGEDGPIGRMKDIHEMLSEIRSGGLLTWDEYEELSKEESEGWRHANDLANEAHEIFQKHMHQVFRMDPKDP